MNARGGVATYVPVPNPRHWKPIPGLAAVAGAAAPPPRSFPAPAPLPATSRSVMVHTLSADFAAATHIVSAPLPVPGPGEVLIERRWTGVNASDINFTSGRYFGGVKAATALLPFGAGFESVGVVAALGADVQGLSLGQPVATTTYGGFSEYAVEPWKMCVPVPEVGWCRLTASTPVLKAPMVSALKTVI